MFKEKPNLYLINNYFNKIYRNRYEIKVIEYFDINDVFSNKYILKIYDKFNKKTLKSIIEIDYLSYKNIQKKIDEKISIMEI